MPVLTAGGPPAVTDLAQRLASDLNRGSGGRQTIGSKAAAFTWSAGLPQILATRVNSAMVEGLTFQATTIKPSATPVDAVAEGGQKPNALEVATATKNLTKYAGIATVSTEQTLSVDALVPSLVAVLSHGILMAYDADCAAALAAENGLTASGATWADAVLAGIAQVAGNGGVPSILAVSAADYPAVVASPGVGYALDPSTSTVSLFGLHVQIMVGVAAGTGFVLDANAVLATENEASPIAVVDVGSGLGTNAVKVAAEAFLGFTVSSPAGVCEITKTGAAAATGGGGERKRSNYALGA